MIDHEDEDHDTPRHEDVRDVQSCNFKNYNIWTIAVVCVCVHRKLKPKQPLVKMGLVFPTTPNAWSKRPSAFAQEIRSSLTLHISFPSKGNTEAAFR